MLLKFWQLASKLSHILNLEFSIHHTTLDTDISNIDFDHFDEIEIRQSVANTLIEKLEQTLEILKHSAELNIDNQTPLTEYFQTHFEKNLE